VSIAHVAAVLNLGPEVTGTARIVAVVLAEMANTDTDECWPSTATIRRRAGLRQDKYVTRAVQQLAELGLVHVDTQGCPDHRIRADRRPNLYRLTGALAVAHDGGARRAGAQGELTGVRDALDGGARRAVTGVRDAQAKPLVEPSLEPERDPASLFAPALADVPRGTSDDPQSAAQPVELTTVQRANRIARHVFEHKMPRPSQPFPAVLKIAQRLIEAGHVDDDVQSAMMLVAPISTGTVEFELGRRTRQPSAVNAPTQNRTVGRIAL
jgi:hypothetical protein